MDIWGILCWIVFGFIVGGLARFIMPGRQEMGWITTILLGIAGSFAGGTISSFLFGGEGLIQPAGWIMSILGGLLVLFIYSRIVAK